MSIKTEISANTARISIHAPRLDMASSDEFRIAYKEIIGKAQTYIIDLKEVTFLDSSAIGIFLLFSEELGHNHNIELHNACPTVIDILDISGLDRLFKVTPL